MDIVGSIVDLVHLLNGQDGLSATCGVQQLLARVLAPSTFHWDSDHRQEAWVTAESTCGSLCTSHKYHPCWFYNCVFVPTPPLTFG